MVQLSSSIARNVAGATGGGTGGREKRSGGCAAAPVRAQLTAAAAGAIPVYRAGPVAVDTCLFTARTYLLQLSRTQCCWTTSFRGWQNKAAVIAEAQVDHINVDAEHHLN